MGKLRRAGFLLVTWKGDHPPRHVHVYHDGRLVVKWKLDDHVAMQGRPTDRVLRPIADLQEEGGL